MADLQETIGTVIRHMRQEVGLTLKELADRAILSVVYLGEIERGKKYPSALVLERLASALDLTVPDLLERVADELRGVAQPQMLAASAIGFSLPERQPLTRTTPTGQVLSMLVA
jgi:transcriptional regulator with XRE-family HTH domain